MKYPNFGAKTLPFLEAYLGHYFALRSGNFYLRNATLPKLGELSFAYGHTKYQKPVCQVIDDMLHLPYEIKKHFELGEWTMSISGRPFRNAGLDEGEWTQINDVIY